MGLNDELKIPIDVNATNETTSKLAPIFPTTCCLTNLKISNEKMIKNNPPKTIEPLNRFEIIPACTPKSLNALFVQLNWSHEATDKRMHTRTKTGVINPMLQMIFSDLSLK